MALPNPSKDKSLLSSTTPSFAANRQSSSKHHTSLQNPSRRDSPSQSELSSPVYVDSPQLSDESRADQRLASSSFHRQNASISIASTGLSSAASVPRVGVPSPTTTAANGDIEMKPVGHRRRISSLITPIHSSLSQYPQSPSTPDDTRHGEDRRSRETGRRDSFSDEDLHEDEETGLTSNDRARKQKKRRRNTLLDQRIVKESDYMEVDEKQQGNESVVRSLLINASLIALWYIFSLSISLYNKWMFDEKRLNFAFPLFTTSLHMIVQFSLAALVLYLIPSLRPSHALRASDQGRSRQVSETKSTGMDKMFYITRIGPCGTATGLDIGLGNMSLKFVSLTFYTMCKSSSLAFVLMFAFVFRLEAPTWRLVSIIAVMTAGVVLMVFGEVEFRLGGFILVILAAFFSGFRWSLTQLLLLRNPATSNPFSSIYYLTPVMFVTLFVLAIPVEGFVPFFEGMKVLSGEYGAVMAPLFLLFPGCIAFSLTTAEYALLRRTSVVTLSIAGIFKEVLTISAASMIFNDKLTPINFVGLITTIGAIVAYNILKISKMRAENQTQVDGREDDYAAFTPSSASDDENKDENEETAGLLLHEDEPSAPSNSGDGGHDPAPSHVASHADKEVQRLE